MRFRLVLGSIGLAGIVALSLVGAGTGCSSSDSSDGAVGGPAQDAGNGSADGAMSTGDGASAADGDASQIPTSTDCKLVALTAADVMPSFVTYNATTTVPPAQTGGTLSGMYIVDKTTVYLPAKTAGLADPTKSTGTVNAWAVFDGTRYLIHLKVDLSISTLIGPQAQTSDTTTQGGFTVAAEALTIDHSCDTVAAPVAEYSFTDSGTGRATILVKTVDKTYGDTYLLLEASKS